MRCKVRLCEVLLRHHSELKNWYRKLASQVSGAGYEEGFFLDFKTFFKLLVDTRMVNGRLNMANLARYMKAYFWDGSNKECFDPNFNKEEVMLKIYLAKLKEQEALMDANKNGRLTPKLKSNRSQFSRKGESTFVDTLPEIPADREKVIEDTNLANYFLFKWQQLIDGQQSLDEVNPPLFFTDFINCLIMAVHLKSGHVISLAGNLSGYIKKRIVPIMENRIRPKVLIPDESAILTRGKEVLSLNDDKWRKEIKLIWKSLTARAPHKIPVV